MPRVLLWLLWCLLQGFFSLVSQMSAFATICISAVFKFRSKESLAAQNFSFVRATKLLTVAVAMESEDARKWNGKVLQLLLWLAAANVNHVTLYDPEGTLKSSSERLQECLKGKDQLVLCYPRKHSMNDMGTSGSSPSSPHSVEETQDAKESDHGIRRRKYFTSQSDCCQPDADLASCTEVELVSLEDGKEALVKAARLVCEEALQICGLQCHAKELNEDDIQGSLLLSRMSKTTCRICSESDKLHLGKRFHGPDPDLLLLFGSTRSLLGFPPWRLRLTEIVHMGALKDITATSYMSALKEFAKKTHRYGR